MDKNISPADGYEERIRILLRKLGFTKVKGEKSFTIGGNQIDACGVYDNKLVIIECTTQIKTLRSKIETWKGKQASIRKGLDILEEYRKYNNDSSLRFVIASRYSAIKQYEEMAKEGQSKVSLWGPEIVYYYEKLAKAIPSRASYDVLADLGFEMKTNEMVTIPAFQVISKGVEMYSFFISPDDLIKISYVARRESGKKNFYQRMVDPSRLSDIYKFIKKGGIFPTNIVVGINGNSTFQCVKPNNISFPNWLSFGVLTFPKSYQSCWVIDGQHRLFSFKKGMSQKLSVLAFGNIDLNKQTRFFVDVNKEAKPISSMLIWDLVGDLRPQSEEGIISNAVKQANTMLPLKGKISIPSVGSGKISLASFCDSLLRAGFARSEMKAKEEYLVKNPFYDKDCATFSKNIADSLSLIFGKIEETIQDTSYLKDFIFGNGGVSVFVQFYKIIICLEGKKVNSAIFSKYFVPVIDYLKTQGTSVINDYRKKCASEGGKRLVLNDFLKLILDVNPNIEDYISEKVDLLDELIDLEVKTRNILEIELKRKDFSAIKKRFNQSIVQQIEASIKRKTQDEVSDFCNQLSLGQVQNFITRELWSDIFKYIFTRPESTKPDINELRFPNEILFKMIFEQAAKTRNDMAHRGIVPTIKDKEALLSFIYQIKSIISSTYKI